MYVCMHVDQRLRLLFPSPSLSCLFFLFFFFYFPVLVSHVDAVFPFHMNAIISYTEFYHMHVPVIPKTESSRFDLFPSGFSSRVDE